MTPTQLYRPAAGAGLLCALLLAVNAARRANLLPDTAFTGAIAPFAALAGLFALTGLYLVQQPRIGALGAAGYLLNLTGLAGAFAVEYTLHYVFPHLTGDQITGLLTAGTGSVFTITAAVLILGVLTFTAASLRARVLPAPALALYLTGMIPGSLRTAVPLPLYLTGLLVAAAGIAWLSLALWQATVSVPSRG